MATRVMKPLSPQFNATVHLALFQQFDKETRILC